MKKRTTLRAGIVRDKRYLEHKPGHTHPEHPSRLRSIYQMIDREFAAGLIEFEPEMATLKQLSLVHTSTYINKVLKTAEHTFTTLAPDTPASANTYISAWLAVGGCIKGLEALENLRVLTLENDFLNDLRIRRFKRRNL